MLAWEQQENAARNISLFLGKGSAAEILSLTQETEGSMGKYLEEMLDSQKDFRQNKIVAIGNLMNQWHNQDELLLIPVLTKQGNRPAITGYGAVLNFEYKGILSVEESMEIFLCQNLLEKFTYEGAENDVVEISELQVTSSVEDTKTAHSLQCMFLEKEEGKQEEPVLRHNSINWNEGLRNVLPPNYRPQPKNCGRITELT